MPCNLEDLVSLPNKFVNFSNCGVLEEDWIPFEEIIPKRELLV